MQGRFRGILTAAVGRVLSSATADSGHHDMRKCASETLVTLRITAGALAERVRDVMNLNAGGKAGGPIARLVRDTFFSERQPKNP
jgi:hypothetical protein